MGTGKIYREAIEEVLKDFTGALLKNTEKLSLGTDKEIKTEVDGAFDALYKEARGLMPREFGGLWEDHSADAIEALEDGRDQIKDYLNQMIELRHLDSEAGTTSGQASAAKPPQKEFSFIKDLKLQRILERDYSEIQRAYAARCWKSVIILSSGAIEAILTDLLLQDPQKATSASSAPRKKTDITTWYFSELIDVCVELKKVGPIAQEVSPAIREYRNLVHPGNEVRTKLEFGEGEAKIAYGVLDMIADRLRP